MIPSFCHRQRSDIVDRNKMRGRHHGGLKWESEVLVQQK